METTRKKTRERTGKRWIDVVGEDLKDLGVERWLETETYGRSVLMAVQF